MYGDTYQGKTSDSMARTRLRATLGDLVGVIICGVSRRTWFRLAASERTPASIRLGASPVWRREDLNLWISLGCPSRKEFEAKEVQGSC